LPLKNAVDVKTGLTEKGLALAEGRFGKAVDFSQGGVAKFSLPTGAQPTETLTLECWVFQKQKSEERLQRIVGRSSNYGFYMSGRSPRLTFFVKGGTQNANWKSVAARIPMKRWVHLAGTYDGVLMKLYVNGKLVGQQKNPGKVRAGRGAFFFGTETGKDQHRFPGLIDEVRLSKIARTEFMTGKPAPRASRGFNRPRGARRAFPRARIPPRRRPRAGSPCLGRTARGRPVLPG